MSSKDKDILELARAMFGDDPKWTREAVRIEKLVAEGNLEDASIGLSHLAFGRLSGVRSGIDVGIARAATALALAYEERGAREDVELVMGMFEHGGKWDPRAKAMVDALAKRLADMRQRRG